MVNRFLMESALRLSAETMQQYRWNMAVFVEFLKGNALDILTVKKNNIEHFLLQCSSLQLRKRRLNILHRFYDYLKSHSKDHIENSASEITVHYRPKKTVSQVPATLKIDALVNAVVSKQTITSTRNHLLVELAYGSGLRRCELHSLNIEDIDYAQRTARINGKGSHVRVVPLTAKSLELITAYLPIRGKENCGPLFLSITTGRRLTKIGISQAFKNNIGIRPHLLRHACATHMLDNGCDIRFIQELLGHKSLSVTQLYTRVSKRKLSEVVNSRHPRSNNPCKRG